LTALPKTKAGEKRIFVNDLVFSQEIWRGRVFAAHGLLFLGNYGLGLGLNCLMTLVAWFTGRRQ
jgi:hypothetical protein